jgi:putative sporulation protein YtaF
MPHLLSSFFLSSACNVDNFAVAVAYGVKKLRIDWLSNLLIALVSALGTILSMSVGTVISRYLPPPVANLLGSGVLIAIGIMGIWDTLERERKRSRQKLRRKQMSRSMVMAGSGSEFVEATVGAEDTGTEVSDLSQLSYETFLENPEQADKDSSGHIDVKEAIALAFGLTINNLGSGVGAGISGLNIAVTAALTFIFSVASVIGGYFLGDRLSARMTGIGAGVISGLMVIGVGIYEYFIP